MPVAKQTSLFDWFHPDSEFFQSLFPEKPEGSARRPSPIVIQQRCLDMLQRWTKRALRSFGVRGDEELVDEILAELMVRIATKGIADRFDLRIGSAARLVRVVLRNVASEKCRRWLREQRVIQIENADLIADGRGEASDNGGELIDEVRRNLRKLPTAQRLAVQSRIDVELGTSSVSDGGVPGHRSNFHRGCKRMAGILGLPRHRRSASKRPARRRRRRGSGPTEGPNGVD